MRTKLHQDHEPAELDITAFMNLMIVLVPVLLMSMVFSHIAVLELRLPESVEQALENAPLDKQQIELEILSDQYNLYFPSGQLVRSYPRGSDEKSSAAADAASQAHKQGEGSVQHKALVEDLKAIKQRLLGVGVDKKDIVLMPAPTVDYQTIIATMDLVRSFKTVVVADVVDAELFPDISFSDAVAGVSANDRSDPSTGAPVRDTQMTSGLEDGSETTSAQSGAGQRGEAKEEL